MVPQREKSGYLPAASARRGTRPCEILRAAPEDPAPLRVLVVDDEPLMRWSIAESLRDRHHRVLEAADGAEALRLLSAAEFDTIVLDYRLPDSDDLTLLGRIREMAPLTPVIMISAHSSPAFADHARRVGAYAVIEKPFELRTLASILARVGQGR
jgi:DNA-binding NtrC family response regulator